MRNLFLIAIIVAAAFMAGWFTISRDDEHTTIKFNRDEIRNDARVAIDRGRELLNKHGQPGTDENGTQLTAQQDQYAQPYPPQYAPGPQQPSSQYQQPQYYPQDRTAANPQADWNRQGSSYRPPQPANAQPTQWQQPQPASAGQYPSGQNTNGPYPSQSNDYQVPRQY